MSARTLKRMVVVLAVLVLAWVVATITGGDAPEPGEGGGEMADFLESLTPQAATGIAFTGGETDTAAVRLHREGGAAGWVVDGHPVDSAQVARFLSALEEAETGAPVSVNPANHRRMEIDEASARMLVLEGPSGADTLLVGQSGPAGTSVYARLPGRDAVHLLSADLRGHARRSAENWRSKRVVAIDTAAVGAVEVEREGTAYRVERADSVWTVQGEAADDTALRELMRSLHDLAAAGFVDEAGDDEEATAPTRSVTVGDLEGQPMLVLRLWEPSEDDIQWEALATGPAAFQPDEPFLLPSFRADLLAPDPGTLRGAEGS